MSTPIQAAQPDASVPALERSRSRAGWFWSIAIVALSFRSVFTLWDRNHFQQPRLGRAFIVAAIVAAIAIVMLGILTRVMHRPADRFGPGLALAVFAFFNWDGAGEGIEAIGAALLVILIAVLSYRVGSARAFKAVAFVLVVTLSVPSILGVAGQVIADEKLTLPRATGLPPLPEPERKPDVYYIVLDAYGRDDTLREMYGVDSSSWLGTLEREGFHVARNAVSNYSMTYASIPSALNMDYVLTPGEIPSRQKYLALQRASGGANTLSSIMKGWGYEFLQIESGSTETRCGPEVDRCLAAPFFDEMTWTLMERTPFRGAIMKRYGAYTTQASLSGLAHLRRIVAADPPEPRFVVAHILLPHPPLQLDAECAIQGRDDLGGSLMRFPWMSEDLMERRRAAYGAQLSCLQRTLVPILEQIPRDAIVVLQGDHGPDSHGQLTMGVDEWLEPAIRERMTIFAAFRGPGLVPALPSVVSPVNIFRAMLAGSFGADVELLPTRVFGVSPRHGFVGSRQFDLDLFKREETSG